RRHTRFSRDWSSDVCSSDLAGLAALPLLLSIPGIVWEPLHRPLIELRLGSFALEIGAVLLVGLALAVLAAVDAFTLPKRSTFSEIGRASCRERVYVAGGAVP